MLVDIIVSQFLLRSEANVRQLRFQIILNFLLSLFISCLGCLNHLDALHLFADEVMCLESGGIVLLVVAVILKLLHRVLVVVVGNFFDSPIIAITCDLKIEV